VLSAAVEPTHLEDRTFDRDEFDDAIRFRGTSERRAKMQAVA
jgi:hypothetical protein